MFHPTLWRQEPKSFQSLPVKNIGAQTFNILNTSFSPSLTAVSLTQNGRQIASSFFFVVVL